MEVNKDGAQVLLENENIVSVQTSICGCLCMRVSAPEAINHQWHDIDWLNKGYNFYMAAVVIISDGHSLKTEVGCSNQPNRAATFALQNDVKWCHRNFCEARHRDFNGVS